MFITKSTICEFHANLFILIILFLSVRYILFLLIKSASIVQKYGFSKYLNPSSSLIIFYYYN